MANNENNGNGDNGNKDALYLFGGLALMVLGAGLVMTNSTVRKSVSAGIAGVLPELQGKFLPDLGDISGDIQRYMRLRSM